MPDLDDENRILDRQMDDFRARLDFDTPSGVIRRYESLHLLEQSIFVIDHPHSRLARAYRKLVLTLLQDNPEDRDGAMLFLDHPPVSIFNIEAQRSENKNRFHEIARHFKGDVEILNKVFDSFVRAKDYSSAVTVLDRLLQLGPNTAGLDEERIRDIRALRERLLALEPLPSDSGSQKSDSTEPAACD